MLNRGVSKRAVMSGGGLPLLGLALVVAWAPGGPSHLNPAAWLRAEAGAAAPGAQGAPRVVRVPITGMIELGMAPFVARALSEATASGASAVVLDLDTPGGRVDAAWKIIDDLRDAEVPTFAYVNRRALSAGAMIALAADRIYMRPGSTMGAATPVTGDGEKASEKMVSAMRSEFRALAQDRGLDPMIAEAMVDESVEVPGVSEAGKLLTLTTAEATEIEVADGEVRDFLELLEEVGLEGAAVSELRPNWAEAIVRFLTNPVVAPLLLSLGFLGIIVEVRTPSFGIAGRDRARVAGGLLRRASHRPPRGAGGDPSLRRGGRAHRARNPRHPRLRDRRHPRHRGGARGGRARDGGPGADVRPGVQRGRTRRLLDHPRRGRGVGARAPPAAQQPPRGLFLRDSTSRETGYISTPPREDLVGQLGITTTDLRPAGVARVGDERIHVVTEGPWLEAETPVRVLEVGSGRVVVRRARDGSAADAPTDAPASEDADGAPADD